MPILTFVCTTHVTNSFSSMYFTPGSHRNFHRQPKNIMLHYYMYDSDQTGTAKKYVVLIVLINKDTI